MNAVDNNITFGQAIQAKLDQLKISKSEFARRLEVDPSYISRIVSGQRVPAVEMVKKMAKVLGVKQQSLLVLVGEIKVEETTPVKPQAAKTTKSTGRKTSTAQSGKEQNVKSSKTQTITLAKFNTLRSINPSLTFVDVDDDGNVVVDSAELERTKQVMASTPGHGVTEPVAQVLSPRQQTLAALNQQPEPQATPEVIAFTDARSTCRLENAKRYSKATKKYEPAPRLFKLVDSYKKDDNGKPISITVKNEALLTAFNTGQASYDRYDGRCTYQWDLNTDQLTITVGSNVVFNAILSRKAVQNNAQAQAVIFNPKSK